MYCMNVTFIKKEVSSQINKLQSIWWSWLDMFNNWSIWNGNDNHLNLSYTTTGEMELLMAAIVFKTSPVHVS
jgi:hypothetical protein